MEEGARGPRVSMFTGHYEHTIDAKGRVSLPAKYREAIAARGSDRLMVTADIHNILLAFALDEWQAFMDKLGALPSMDPRVRMVKRHLIGGAHEVQFDGNGRILLPAPLRQHAQLDREVVFVGIGDRIEIWSKAGWDASHVEEDTAALEKAYQELGF